MRHVIVLVALLALLVPTAHAARTPVECISLVTSQNAGATTPLLQLGSDQIVIGVETTEPTELAAAIVIVPSACGTPTPAVSDTVDGLPLLA